MRSACVVWCYKDWTGIDKQDTETYLCLIKNKIANKIVFPAKWRNFHLYFLDWQLLYLIHLFHRRLFPFVPDNGLVQSRWQAIIRTNDGQVYWRVHEPLCLEDLGITLQAIRINSHDRNHHFLGTILWDWGISPKYVVLLWLCGQSLELPRELTATFGRVVSLVMRQYIPSCQQKNLWVILHSGEVIYIWMTTSSWHISYNLSRFDVIISRKKFCRSFRVALSKP